VTFIRILITLRDYERFTYIYERRSEVFWAVAAVPEKKQAAISRELSSDNVVSTAFHYQMVIIAQQRYVTLYCPAC
jgi:hypothetical protein